MIGKYTAGKDINNSEGACYMGINADARPNAFHHEVSYREITGWESYAWCLYVTPQASCANYIDVILIAP